MPNIGGDYPLAFRIGGTCPPRPPLVVQPMILRSGSALTVSPISSSVPCFSRFAPFLHSLFPFSPLECIFFFISRTEEPIVAFPNRIPDRDLIKLQNGIYGLLISL